MRTRDEHLAVSSNMIKRIEYKLPTHLVILFSCHCFELPFVFGNFEKWENAPMLENADDKMIRSLSSKFQEALTHFIEEGTPNKENAMIWPKYNAEKRMTLVVNEKMEAVIDPIDMQSDIHNLI
ncbi:carboxylesterase family protein [Bacillus chungangensis]|uniref:Carboxylesterase type B n=1 Tax=Bacillus chungangensis TaxID=587633 RepID=A0ABT9WUX2_9BACI|nr:carboxylesterase family protein [Bacillus chungangensis]MDQ0176580.1 carboxylesterase type B [Bacillus chungangensis]